MPKKPNVKLMFCLVFFLQMFAKYTKRSIFLVFERQNWRQISEQFWNSTWPHISNKRTDNSWRVEKRYRQRAEILSELFQTFSVLPTHKNVIWFKFANMIFEGWQCENFIIFLPLRFFVKSILVNDESLKCQKRPFCHF